MAAENPSPGAAAPVPRSWVVVLAAAAAARLLLQVLAMPPYAGLDEGYHVARVAFVAEEGRQPVAREASVPQYLARSMAGEPGAPAGFGTLEDRWPAVVAARPEGWRDVTPAPADRRAYVAPNYESQQPPLYYAAAAGLDRLAPTELGKLLALRLLAVLCGAAAAVATGLLAARLWGAAGLLAGLLLISTPTWITLVARAGNDGPACAALAAALLLSLRPDGGRMATAREAACWAAAVALKVYTWPAVLLLPLVWPAGAGRGRRLAVAASASAAGVLTALDLLARTGNPIGSIAFRSAGGISVSGVSLDRLAALPWLQFFKVFAGSAIWTSGQHANFLRPAGLGLFLLPWVVLVAAAALAARRMPRRPFRLLAAAAVVFALAEVAQAWGYIRDAAMGLAETRSAGLAGWYLHAFDPIWFGVGGGFALSALARRRWTAALLFCLAGAFAADVFVTEGALFCDYAGLSSPLAPGAFFRWGGGSPWEALARLGRYGLWLSSPWLAVSLRAVEAALGAALVGACLRAAGRPDAAGTENTL